MNQDLFLRSIQDSGNDIAKNISDDESQDEERQSVKIIEWKHRVGVTHEMQGENPIKKLLRYACRHEHQPTKMKS